MKLEEYIEAAGRTDAPLGDDFKHGLHMVIGMATEVGELQDIYKKRLAYDKPIDEVNEKEELGDLMWYIANHVRWKGWDLEEIMQTNIDKLKARFPEKFDNEKALNRDLTKERKILER